MIDWKSILLDSQDKIEIYNRYTDIMLCKEFWRTEQDILEMSDEFYSDSKLLLSKINAKNLANKKNGNGR